MYFYNYLFINSLQVQFTVMIIIIVQLFNPCLKKTFGSISNFSNFSTAQCLSKKPRTHEFLLASCSQVLKSQHMSNQKAENELYKPQAVACFFGSSNCPGSPILACCAPATSRPLGICQRWFLGSPVAGQVRTFAQLKHVPSFFLPQLVSTNPPFTVSFLLHFFPSLLFYTSTLFRCVSSLILLTEQLCRCNWLWRGNVQPGMESIKPLRQAAARCEATAIGDAMN